MMQAPYAIQITCPECGTTATHKTDHLANGLQINVCEACDKNYVCDAECTVQVTVYKILGMK